MHKAFLRICSMLLTLAILIHMFPLSIWAAENQTQDEPSTNQSNAEGNNQNVYVLNEITENRTEYSKEFRLSNGLNMAAVYSTAVHYEKDGHWEDIDNTLKLSSTRAGNVYTNTAGSWKVSLPQKLNKETGVTIEKDGYTLSFYLNGELRVSAEREDGNQSTLQAESSILGPIGEASAKVEQIDLTEIKNATEHEQTVAAKLNSRLRYESVFAGTDVVYDLTSGQVKESIIMEKYDASLRGYSYILDVGEMVPVLTESNDIELYDKQGKDLLMVMPAPYLFDSSEEYCFDVAVSLKKSGEQWILAYILPQEWIADTSRQWPVTLDPVVSTMANNTNAEDQTVYENTNIYTQHTAIVINSGYNSACKTMRTYIKYTELPALTSADMIVSASMEFYATAKEGSATILEIREVLESWDASTIKWGTQPDYSDVVEDFAICAQKEMFYNWDITDIVRSWYVGSNYGMVIKATDEQEAARVNNWLRFLFCELLFRLQTYADYPLQK